MVVSGYSINYCWQLFYQWLLMAIISMVVGGYSINGFWWLFY
jgi:hypothetical protein